MLVRELMGVLTYDRLLCVSVNDHLYKNIFRDVLLEKYGDFKVTDLSPTESNLYLDITNGGIENE